ncbi:MAG: hypothetical protein GF328_08880, partial [Candidatus Latescibacteria bacterium]|nr:hypothetical protein [Candidatus Latescibacterota bacterium]
MMKIAVIFLAGFLFLGNVGVPPADARVDLRFDAEVDLSEAERIAMRGRLESRVAEAVRFLSETTDYRLDPGETTVRFRIGYERDHDGTVLPACYTFPDSTVRLVPSFAGAPSDAKADRIFREILRLGTSPEGILSRCSPWERAIIPDLIDAFTFSELVHELYHDWQNRRARFPEIEAAKLCLRALSGVERSRAVRILQKRGIDLQEHRRQIAHAEEEATLIQRFCWER